MVLFIFSKVNIFNLPSSAHPSNTVSLKEKVLDKNGNLQSFPRVDNSGKSIEHLYFKNWAQGYPNTYTMARFSKWHVGKQR
jgi:hypothetical protein